MLIGLSGCSQMGDGTGGGGMFGSLGSSLGLSGGTGLLGQRVQIQRLSISCDPDANNKFPMKVFLGIAYDPQVAATLGRLTATEIAAHATQLKRDHADFLEIFAWEVVPGQIVPDTIIKMDKPGAGIAGFIYATYNTPGEHRVRITGDINISVRLERDDLRIMPVMAAMPRLPF